MNTLTVPPSSTSPVDEDLAEQAKPGHGIPSMDTRVAAQILLEPDEAEREVKTALTGGGWVAVAATGAPIAPCGSNSTLAVNMNSVSSPQGAFTGAGRKPGNMALVQTMRSFFTVSK